MSGDPLEQDQTDPGVKTDEATTDPPAAGADAEPTAADAPTIDADTTGESDGAAAAAMAIDPDSAEEARAEAAEEEEAEKDAEEEESKGPPRAAGEAGEPLSVETSDDEVTPSNDEGSAPDADDESGPESDDGFPNELDATVNLTGDFDATVNLTGNDLLDTTVNLTGADLPAPPVRDDAAVAHEVTRVHLKGLLEALIFASDKPVKTNELAKSASAPAKDVKGLLEELRNDYAPRGMQLEEVAGGWVFRTNAAYAPFVRDLTKQKPVRLSRAQIETLAILAYRQPVTRPEIDEIRGVDCGPVLKVLLERDLVRMLGRKDEPGRPVIYGTTVQFLELFGLKSLKDLPTLREFTDLNEESRRTVERELGETLEETVAALNGEAAGGGPRIPAPSDTLPPDGDGSVVNTEIPPAMSDDEAETTAHETLDEHGALEEPPAAADAEAADPVDSDAHPFEHDAAEESEPDPADGNDEENDEENDDERDAEPKTKTAEELAAEEEFPDDDDDDFDEDDDEEEEGEDGEKNEDEESE